MFSFSGVKRNPMSAELSYDVDEPSANYAKPNKGYLAQDCIFGRTEFRPRGGILTSNERFADRGSLSSAPLIPKGLKGLGGIGGSCNRVAQHLPWKGFVTGPRNPYFLLAMVATLLFMGGAPAFGAAEEAAGTAVTKAEQSMSEGVKAEKEHGLPQGAVEVGRVFGLPITNSMIVTWLTAIGLITFARVATRRMKEIPDGAQNFWEWMVESLRDFLEGIIGEHLTAKTFWFFASIFIFVLFTNYVGLIPGVGTIGWGHKTEHGFHVDQPWFRGANADLNLTLAMSLIFFACWIVWALQEVGPVGFAKEMFGPKGESTGALGILMIGIFFAVGCLEIISILFRPISLSFRLYGNIFAGENMLEAMATIVPALSWLLPIPFYFMELLVGIVQALVFMLLTAVFTMLICMHHEGEGAAAH